MKAKHFLSTEAGGKPRPVSRGSIAFFALALVACLLYAPDVRAQGSISGTVTEAATGTPLPGVNVVVVGTQRGASTGTDGGYTIENVPAGTYSVRATFIGFLPLAQENIEVTDGGTATVNFSLEETPVNLEEVTVVGYGTQRRQDVTGSVGQIDAENIEALPLTSPDEALQGQIAGVEVQTTAGIPGGGPQIKVRGTGNVGAGGQPLYVVDGFALPQSGYGQSQTRNPLSDIPPEDIQSMTVLKDASATAIYGSRASNGVVIITTKSGSAGSYQVNVSAYTGFNQTLSRTVIDPANAYEFALYENRIWAGRVAAGEADEIPAPYRNPDQYGEGTNWWNEITRTAQQHNVQLSISGGSERLRSYFSAGYIREEGVMLNSAYDRLSLRANLETDLNDRITAGLRIAPSYSVRNLNWEGGFGRAGAGGVAWMITPLAPVELEDGSYNPQPGDESYPGYSPGVWSQPNPVQWLEQQEDNEKSLRTLASAYVDVEVVPGLSLRQSLNADYSTGDRTIFRPSTIGRTRVAPPTVPTGSYLTDNYLNWLSETTLNLNREVGPGQLEALAGFTAQQENELGSGFGGQFPDDDIETLNVASQLTGATNEQGWTLLSGLGRVNYNLRDRFVFTATFRADGSSRFGEDNRWGTFPSGAVAWNIHNESFMAGLRERVPELRARLSYGVTGNNQIGNYAPLGVVGASNYILGGSEAAGRVLNSLGNPALSWERTQEVNAGLDAAFYDYKLRLSAEFYQRNTTDLLLNRELPFLSGFGSVTENTGEVRNRGIELSLHTVNVNQDNYSWLTDFNIALNQNEVVSLPGGNDVTFQGPGPTFFIHREGFPLSTYAGYVIDGLYESEEQIAADPAAYAGAVPGSIIIRDLNGDGAITEDVIFPDGDFAILGDPYPDFSFGITNTISIGPIDFRALVTGSFGGDNLRAEFFRTARNIDGLFVVDSDYVQNMWVSPEQPGDGLTPTVLGGAYGRQQYRDNNHSLVLGDASRIWVRNVMLRYNFTNSLLSGSNVYFSLTNPFIVSPYPGNPDVTSINNGQQPGVDFGNYPLPRTFTFGIDLAL